MLADVLMTLLLLLVVLAVRQYVGMPIRVKGNSMLSTLHSGEVLLVSRVALHTRGIQRGDVVICHYPGRYWDRWRLVRQSFVKRVVGLPGETVEIIEGVVHINGEPVEEPYLDERHTRRRASMPARILGDDEYFVLGDNRDSSNDSRRIGPIRSGDLVGVVTRVVWPLSARRPIRPAESGFMENDAL